jgi:hypothetical protein
MDWLRSEDLKEEKVVTTPIVILSVLIVENDVDQRTVNLQLTPAVILDEA